MDFTFLHPNGNVAFVRDDAETAEWTQEEMSLFCTFPIISEKTITRGMVVLFQDPATGDWKAYEIRNCQSYKAEGYQQVTAEDICISELSDCHIPDDLEYTDITAGDALNGVLFDTGWELGTVGDTGISSADIMRGSVWEAVCDIRDSWNIHIQSRITVTSSGIAKRYLDIISAEGVWRGLRLSISKNTTDPIVTYDDSELYTALYGYGASVTEDGETTETDFSGITWEKTDYHPAKPSGQKYIEDPEKTRLYGRNGKPRFGYYQNSNIDDAEILLGKTWETLKTCSEPKISISGTVADLYRLGYADQPLRLHDMVIVDLDDTEIFYKQIIQLTVNLLDPTANLPTIGDYIPNIIYINRESEDYATDGRVSSGSGSGRTRSSKTKGEFETNILQNERNITLNAKQIDEQGNKIRAAGIDIDPITGVAVYAEDVKNGLGSLFKVQSDRISAEVTNRKNEDDLLSSRITQTANRITLEVSERKSETDLLRSRITMTATEIRSEVSNSVTGLSSRITQNANKVAIVVDDENNLKTASIVAGINDQSGSYVKIKADKINLTGYVTVSDLNAVSATISNLMSGNATASKIVTDDLRLPGSFYYHNNKYTEFYSSTEGKYLLGRT